MDRVSRLEKYLEIIISFSVELVIIYVKIIGNFGERFNNENIEHAHNFLPINMSYTPGSFSELTMQHKSD